jgi:hypothetical protein
MTDAIETESSSRCPMRRRWSVCSHSSCGPACARPSAAGKRTTSSIRRTTRCDTLVACCAFARRRTLGARAQGPAHATANAALQARAEEQRPLDAALAEAARKGTRSPVELLAESHPESDLVRRARDLLGGRPLVERAGFVNERLRLEPGLLVAPWGEPWHLVLELDRTVFPGGPWTTSSRSSSPT